jgi:EmrB/QacA subfamily drug resistance transporter
VPVWGKLSDLYGRRPFYILSIIFFVAGSTLAGLAQSMGQLIIFRLIQGAGAGGSFAVGMTIIAELYTPVERAKIQGYFGMVWGVASILGPLVGGFVTDQFNWRWVFFLNIPFGIAAIVIIASQLVENRSHFKGGRMELFGISSFTGAMTLLMVLLIRSETSFDFRSAATLALLGGTIVCLFLFVRNERHAEEPVLPAALLRNALFRGAALNGCLGSAAIFGLISFIPLFLQGVQGTGATEAGSALTPLLLGWVICSTLGGRLLLRFTFRQVMMMGMVTMFAGFLLLDMMTPETARVVVLRNCFIVGAGMGLTMITSMIAVQHGVERSQLGIATSTAQFFRSIGSAIGVAVMGTVMTQRLNQQIALGPAVDGLRQLAEKPDALLQSTARAGLPPGLVHTFQQMLGNSLHYAFIVGTVICAAAVLTSFLMPSLRLVNPASAPLRDVPELP